MLKMSSVYLRMKFSGRGKLISLPQRIKEEMLLFFNQYFAGEKQHGVGDCLPENACAFPYLKINKLERTSRPYYTLAGKLPENPIFTESSLFSKQIKLSLLSLQFFMKFCTGTIDCPGQPESQNHKVKES